MSSYSNHIFHPPPDWASGGEEQRNKSATPHHAHPNRIQLTCPPCNRPTLIERLTVCPTPRRKRSKRSSSRRNNKWPNRMSHTLLLQCPHTYHHMPSSIIPRANHQQIKQHHNHQSTTHPPHHHRHHPYQQSISSSRPSRLDNNNQQESNIERVRDSVKDHLIHQRNHHPWQTNLPLFRCGSVRSMHRVPSQPLDPRQQTTHTHQE